MQKIEGELRTNYQKDVTFFEGNFLDKTGRFTTKKKWDFLGGTVNKVRSSEGFQVKNFRDLIAQVAIVTLNNSNFEMYYRGQTQDYLNNKSIFYKDRKQKTIIFPNICRPDINEDGSYKYSIRQNAIQKRYEDLYKFIDYANNKNRMKVPYEVYMALIQHYEIMPTPLIDITQSLRVAATFALRQKKKGFLYVFGLPYLNQSISYYRDFEIILLKLQNVVSFDALRPRYQEGYLVGKFPITNRKDIGDNLANRLIAKFELDNSSNKFWDKFFLPMPDEVLFPKDDTTEQNLKNLKAEFDKI